MTRLYVMFCMLLICGMREATALADPINEISVPCLLDDKTVATPNIPGFTCTRALKKCSLVRTEMINKVRDLISWKIYGFYNNVDLDLSKPIDPAKIQEKMSGVVTAEPICSVVGHVLDVSKRALAPTPDPNGARRYLTCNNQSKGVWVNTCTKEETAGYFPGDDKYLELETAVINRTKLDTAGIQVGAFSGCGQRPVATYNGKKLLTSNIKAGPSQWTAYVRGGMIWALRRATYDVLTAIPDDLKNLQQYALSGQRGVDDVVSDYYSSLTGIVSNAYEQAKTSQGICTADATDSDCGTNINESMIQICSLKTLTLVLSDSNVPTLLVKQIISRAEFLHTLYFRGVFNPESFGKIKNREDKLKKLFDDRVHDSSDVAGFVSGVFYGNCGKVLNRFGPTKNRQTACAAACIFGPPYGIEKDTDAVRRGYNKKRNSCYGYWGAVNSPFKYSLVASESERDSSVSETYAEDGRVNRRSGNGNGGRSKTRHSVTAAYTLNYGFPAIIEKQTRVMCRQFDSVSKDVLNNIPNLCDKACLSADPRRMPDPKDATKVVSKSIYDVPISCVPELKFDVKRKDFHLDTLERREKEFVTEVYNPDEWQANMAKALDEDGKYLYPTNLDLDDESDVASQADKIGMLLVAGDIDCNVVGHARLFFKKKSSSEYALHYFEQKGFVKELFVYAPIQASSWGEGKDIVVHLNSVKPFFTGQLEAAENGDNSTSAIINQEIGGKTGRRDTVHFSGKKFKCQVLD